MPIAQHLRRDSHGILASMLAANAGRAAARRIRILGEIRRRKSVVVAAVEEKVIRNDGAWEHHRLRIRRDWRCRRRYGEVGTDIAQRVVRRRGERALGDRIWRSATLEVMVAVVASAPVSVSPLTRPVSV